MPATKTCYTLDSLKWYDRLPASPATRVGDLVFVAGQVALDRDLKAIAPGDVKAQARHAFESLRQILEAAGGSLADVIDVISFHKDVRDIETVLELGREYFPSDPPAWTPAGFIGSYTPDALVAIKAIAHLGSEKKECYTPDSQRWRRSYPMSGGCRKGSLLFVSGQVATDADGNVITPSDHDLQARRAYDGMREVVRMAGGTVEDILDFTSFHQDIRGAQSTLTDIYIPEVIGADSFSTAASTSHIGVPGLHKLGMLGAYRATVDFSPGKRVPRTPASIWWRELFPIAGGAKKEGGGLITIAGQVASAADASIVSPYDVVGQARYVLDCIEEILAEFGGTMDNVVEVTSFHKDPRAWEIVMQVGEEYFGKDEGPAWTPVGCSGLWMEGYLHEIAALAVV